MMLTLLLMAEDKRFTVALPLSHKRIDYADTDNYSANIVYQWTKYPEIRICGLDVPSIYCIGVSVNGSSLKIERWTTQGDAMYGKLSKLESRIFANIFGITSISVTISLAEKKSMVFHSGPLAVAIEADKEEYSVQLLNMVRYIHRHDRQLLLKSLHPRRNDSFAASLHECVKTLWSCLPAFQHAPIVRNVYGWRSLPLDRVQTMSGRDLAFLATHPHQFRACLDNRGIMMGQRFMLPERLHARVEERSWDTYENHVVIGFITYLLEYACERLINLREMVEDSDYFDLQLHNHLLPGYVLSDELLQQFLQRLVAERYRDAERTVCELRELRELYGRALPCAAYKLVDRPPRTLAFIEQPHYCRVFNALERWYASLQRNVMPDETTVHLASADVVYELYCLKNIQSLIEQAGYIEDTSRRCTFSYSLHRTKGVSSKYSTYTGDNTFYYRNPDSGCELTLYYQPFIFVDGEEEVRNGIDLMRVDACNPKQYYSPDFLFKRVDEYGTAYGIIDAKWRNRDNIRNDAEPNVVNKYLVSIVERQTWQTVKFLWLLQGKEDTGPMEIYRRYSNPRCVGPEAPEWLYNSMGVVSLTPESGTEALAEVLDTFLQPGTCLDYNLPARRNEDDIECVIRNA